MFFWSPKALSANQNSNESPSQNSVLIYKELKLEEKQLLDKENNEFVLKSKSLDLKKSNPIQKKPKKGQSNSNNQNKQTNKNAKDLKNLKDLEEKPKSKSLNEESPQQSQEPNKGKNTENNLEEDGFDLSFIKKGQLGSSFQNIDFLEKNFIPPGEYDVKINLNERFIGKLKLNFILHNKLLTPCIDASLLDKLNLKDEINTKINLELQKNSCVLLEQNISNSSFKFNSKAMQLDFVITDNFLKKSEYYNYDKDKITNGENSLFFNYYIQHYASLNLQKEHTTKNSTSNLALSIGANMGDLHLRSSINLSSNNFSNTTFNYGSVYGHFDLPSIYSQVLFGLISTSTTKTSNSSIVGVSFTSDANMRPISKQGYAPEITGFANSNAVVIIKQNDIEIYRINVARGNFTISDLVNIDLNKDLTMIIKEADGSIKTKTIPVIYIAPVLRKNTYEYNSAFGFYTENFQTNWKQPILTGEFNYGIHNNVSLLTGLNLSIFRQELASMIIYNSLVGNFNFDLNLVHSQILKKHYFGLRIGVSYSKYFPETKTNLSLAAYNFSMKNYFGLSEVIKSNQQKKDISIKGGMKNRFNLGINQTLPINLGNLNFSLSYNDFWDNLNSNLAFSLNYGISFKNISLRLGYQGNTNLYLKNYSDSLSLSVSMPFSNPKYASGSLTNSIYMYPNKSVKEDIKFQHDLGLGITFADLQNMSFGVNVTNNNNEDMSISANASAQYSKVDLSANFSYNTRNYLQYSFNANGSIVLHKGGINFTKNLGSSFAIIEALNASNATINNDADNKIGLNGYGIVKNISPYRLNKINLDTKGLSSKLTLDRTLVEVFPNNYSSPLIKFNTNIENSVVLELNLIQTNKQNKSAKTEAVPAGSVVYNEENKEIAFVGMKGRTYIKTKNINSSYKAVWGNNEKDSCTFKVKIDEKEFEDEEIPFYELECIQ